MSRFRTPSIADGLNETIAETWWSETPAPGEQVYFIGTEDGPVKIGRSIDVQGRLANMQTGSPVKLSILAVVDGGRALERQYHVAFACFRLHGEWFEMNDRLRQEIKRYAW